jgi:hypothetical protein
MFKCLSDLLKAMTEPKITNVTAENILVTIPPLITLSGHINTISGNHGLLVPVTLKFMDAPIPNTQHNINIFKLVKLSQPITETQFYLLVITLTRLGRQQEASNSVYPTSGSLL